MTEPYSSSFMGDQGRDVFETEGPTVGPWLSDAFYLANSFSDAALKRGAAFYADDETSTTGLRWFNNGRAQIENAATDEAMNFSATSAAGQRSAFDIIHNEGYAESQLNGAGYTIFKDGLWGNISTYVSDLDRDLAGREHGDAIDWMKNLPKDENFDGETMYSKWAEENPNLASQLRASGTKPEDFKGVHNHATFQYAVKRALFRRANQTAMQAINVNLEEDGKFGNATLMSGYNMARNDLVHNPEMLAMVGLEAGLAVATGGTSLIASSARLAARSAARQGLKRATLRGIGNLARQANKGAKTAQKFGSLLNLPENVIAPGLAKGWRFIKPMDEVAEVTRAHLVGAMAIEGAAYGAAANVSRQYQERKLAELLAGEEVPFSLSGLAMETGMAALFGPLFLGAGVGLKRGLGATLRGATNKAAKRSRLRAAGMKEGSYRDRYGLNAGSEMADRAETQMLADIEGVVLNATGGHRAGVLDVVEPGELAKRGLTVGDLSRHVDTLVERAGGRHIPAPVLREQLEYWVKNSGRKMTDEVKADSEGLRMSLLRMARMIGDAGTAQRVQAFAERVAKATDVTKDADAFNLRRKWAEVSARAQKHLEAGDFKAAEKAFAEMNRFSKMMERGTGISFDPKASVALMKRQLKVISELKAEGKDVSALEAQLANSFGLPIPGQGFNFVGIERMVEDAMPDGMRVSEDALTPRMSEYLDAMDSDPERALEAAKRMSNKAEEIKTMSDEELDELLKGGPKTSAFDATEEELAAQVEYSRRNQDRARTEIENNATFKANQEAAAAKVSPDHQAHEAAYDLAFARAQGALSLDPDASLTVHDVKSLFAGTSLEVRFFGADGKEYVTTVDVKKLFGKANKDGYKASRVAQTLEVLRLQSRGLDPEEAAVQMNRRFGEEIKLLKLEEDAVRAAAQQRKARVGTEFNEAVDEDDYIEQVLYLTKVNDATLAESLTGQKKDLTKLREVIKRLGNGEDDYLTPAEAAEVLNGVGTTPGTTGRTNIEISGTAPLSMKQKDAMYNRRRFIQRKQAILSMTDEQLEDAVRWMESGKADKTDVVGTVTRDDNSLPLAPREGRVGSLLEAAESIDEATDRLMAAMELRQAAGMKANKDSITFGADSGLNPDMTLRNAENAGAGVMGFPFMGARPGSAPDAIVALMEMMTPTASRGRLAESRVLSQLDRPPTKVVVDGEEVDPTKWSLEELDVDNGNAVITIDGKERTALVTRDSDAASQGSNIGKAIRSEKAGEVLDTDLGAIAYDGYAGALPTIRASGKPGGIALDLLDIDEMGKNRPARKLLKSLFQGGQYGAGEKTVRKTLVEGVLKWGKDGIDLPEGNARRLRAKGYGKWENGKFYPNQKMAVDIGDALYHGDVAREIGLRVKLADLRMRPDGSVIPDSELLDLAQMYSKTQGVGLDQAWIMSNVINDAKINGQSIETRLAMYGRELEEVMELARNGADLREVLASGKYTTIRAAQEAFNNTRLKLNAEALDEVERLYGKSVRDAYERGFFTEDLRDSVGRQYIAREMIGTQSNKGETDVSDLTQGKRGETRELTGEARPNLDDVVDSGNTLSRKNVEVAEEAAPLTREEARRIVIQDRLIRLSADYNPDRYLKGYEEPSYGSYFGSPEYLEDANNVHGVVTRGQPTLRRLSVENGSLSQRSKAVQKRAAEMKKATGFVEVPTIQRLSSQNSRDHRQDLTPPPAIEASKVAAMDDMSVEYDQAPRSQAENTHHMKYELDRTIRDFGLDEGDYEAAYAVRQAMRLEEGINDAALRNEVEAVGFAGLGDLEPEGAFGRRVYDARELDGSNRLRTITAEEDESRLATLARIISGDPFASKSSDLPEVFRRLESGEGGAFAGGLNDFVVFDPNNGIVRLLDKRGAQLAPGTVHMIDATAPDLAAMIRSGQATVGEYNGSPVIVMNNFGRPMVDPSDIGRTGDNIVSAALPTKKDDGHFVLTNIFGKQAGAYEFTGVGYKILTRDEFDALPSFTKNASVISAVEVGQFAPRKQVSVNSDPSRRFLAQEVDDGLVNATKDARSFAELSGSTLSEDPRVPVRVDGQEVPASTIRISEEAKNRGLQRYYASKSGLPEGADLADRARDGLYRSLDDKNLPAYYPDAASRWLGLEPNTKEVRATADRIFMTPAELGQPSKSVMSIYLTDDQAKGLLKRSQNLEDNVPTDHELDPEAIADATGYSVVEVEEMLSQPSTYAGPKMFSALSEHHANFERQVIEPLLKEGGMTQEEARLMRQIMAQVKAPDVATPDVAGVVDSKMFPGETLDGTTNIAAHLSAEGESEILVNPEKIKKRFAFAKASGGKKDSNAVVSAVLHEMGHEWASRLGINERKKLYGLLRSPESERSLEDGLRALYGEFPGFDVDQRLKRDLGFGSKNPTDEQLEERLADWFSMTLLQGVDQKVVKAAYGQMDEVTAGSLMQWMRKLAGFIKTAGAKMRSVIARATDADAGLKYLDETITNSIAFTKGNVQFKRWGALAHDDPGVRRAAISEAAEAARYRNMAPPPDARAEGDITRAVVNRQALDDADPGFGGSGPRDPAGPDVDPYDFLEPEKADIIMMAQAEKARRAGRTEGNRLNSKTSMLPAGEAKDAARVADEQHIDAVLDDMHNNPAVAASDRNLVTQSLDFKALRGFSLGVLGVNVTHHNDVALVATLSSLFGGPRSTNRHFSGDQHVPNFAAGVSAAEAATASAVSHYRRLHQFAGPEKMGPVQDRIMNALASGDDLNVGDLGLSDDAVKAAQDALDNTRAYFRNEAELALDAEVPYLNNFATEFGIPRGALFDPTYVHPASGFGGTKINGIQVTDNKSLREAFLKGAERYTPVRLAGSVMEDQAGFIADAAEFIGLSLGRDRKYMKKQLVEKLFYKDKDGLMVLSSDPSVKYDPESDAFKALTSGRLMDDSGWTFLKVNKAHRRAIVDAYRAALKGDNSVLSSEARRELGDMTVTEMLALKFVQEQRSRRVSVKDPDEFLDAQQARDAGFTDNSILTSNDIFGKVDDTLLGAQTKLKKHFDTNVPSLLKNYSKEYAVRTRWQDSINQILHSKGITPEAFLKYAKKKIRERDGGTVARNNQINGGFNRMSAFLAQHSGADLYKADLSDELIDNASRTTRGISAIVSGGFHGFMGLVEVMFALLRAGGPDGAWGNFVNGLDVLAASFTKEGRYVLEGTAADLRQLQETAVDRILSDSTEGLDFGTNSIAFTWADRMKGLYSAVKNAAKEKSVSGKVAGLSQVTGTAMTELGMLPQVTSMARNLQTANVKRSLVGLIGNGEARKFADGIKAWRKANPDADMPTKAELADITFEATGHRDWTVLHMMQKHGLMEGDGLELIDDLFRAAEFDGRTAGGFDSVKLQQIIQDRILKATNEMDRAKAKRQQTALSKVMAAVDEHVMTTVTEGFGLDQATLSPTYNSALGKIFYSLQTWMLNFANQRLFGATGTPTAAIVSGIGMYIGIEMIIRELKNQIRGKGADSREEWKQDPVGKFVTGATSSLPVLGQFQSVLLPWIPNLIRSKEMYADMPFVGEGFEAPRVYDPSFAGAGFGMLENYARSGSKVLQGNMPTIDDAATISGLGSVWWLRGLITMLEASKEATQRAAPKASSKHTYSLPSATREVREATTPEVQTPQAPQVQTPSVDLDSFMDDVGPEAAPDSLGL